MYLAAGCAKPIQSEYYSRTPARNGQEWNAGKPASQLSIGVGVDSPSLAATVRPTANSAAPAAIPLSGPELLAAVNADSKMGAIARAFIQRAAHSKHFKFVGYATPENISSLDMIIELTTAYEHDGNDHVQYCLGRLIANVYDADHSEFLHRIVRFHEAMYTPRKGNPTFTHDGTNVHNRLQNALFDELIESLANDQSVALALKDY